MLLVKTVTPGRGAAWLLDGFEYFKRSAGAWIGVGIILAVISVASAILPFAGFVLQVLFPVFTGGLILGCLNINAGGILKINHLFAGFSLHAGKLLLIGLVYSICTLFIFIIMLIMLFFMAGGLDFFVAVIDGDTSVVLDNVTNVLLVSLIGLSIYLPVLMAVWFAPALVVLEGAEAFTAMHYSFTGCLKNILPFMVYGLISLPLSMLATIPFFLGWFVLGPMLIASIYIASKEIYVHTQA